MKQSPLLIFECADFVATPGEDRETNPGLFGKSLARWLAEQLHAAGFPAGAVFAEDFGWCIPVGSKPHALYVVCAGNGDAQWRVFAFAEGRLIARLLGRDRSAALLAEVFAAVRRCLESAPSVRGLREESP
jgi:hypothetical protein